MTTERQTKQATSAFSMTIAALTAEALVNSTSASSCNNNGSGSNNIRTAAAEIEKRLKEMLAYIPSQLNELWRMRAVYNSTNSPWGPRTLKLYPDGQQTHYSFGKNVQMLPLVKERFAKQQTIEAFTRKIRDHANDVNELKRTIDAMTTVKIWAMRCHEIRSSAATCSYLN